MSKPKITYIACDDWEALYINGTKVAEGHMLYAGDVLWALETEGIIETEDKNIEHLRDEDSGYIDFKEKLSEYDEI